MESKQVKALAEQIRGLAKLAASAPQDSPISREKLDSNHVLNFVRFFGGNQKDAQDG